MTKVYGNVCNKYKNFKTLRYQILFKRNFLLFIGSVVMNIKKVFIYQQIYNYV